MFCRNNNIKVFVYHGIPTVDTVVFGLDITACVSATANIRRYIFEVTF